MTRRLRSSAPARRLAHSAAFFLLSSVASCRFFDDKDAPCETAEHCDREETCIGGHCQCSDGDVDLDECVDGPDRAAVQQRAERGRAAEPGEREDVNCDGVVDAEDLRLVDIVFCSVNCYPCPALDFDDSGCTGDRDVEAWQTAQGRDRDIDCDGTIDAATDGIALSQAISEESCLVPCADEGEGE